MFEIGFTEILVITVLALVVLGPEKLPRVAAQVGRWMGRARAMARQFREQLEEEVQLAETTKAKASTESTAHSTSPGSNNADATGAPYSDVAHGTTAGATDHAASPAADPGPPMYSDNAHAAGGSHYGSSSDPATSPPPEVTAANAAAETAHSDSNGPAPEPEAAEYQPPLYAQVRATHVGTHEADPFAGANGTAHGGANGGEPSSPRSSTVESPPHHEDPPAKAGDVITHTHERGI